MYQRFIENGVLANLTFLLVLAIGTMAYFSMPREQDPTINFNWIEITTVLPGAAAQDIEKLVTDPLEDAIKNISDTKFVSSNSSESISRILVRFDEIDERSFDKRLADLRREIQAVEDEIPPQALSSRVTEITTANAFPTAILAVVGAADDENLRRQAQQIKTGLENVKGVSRVLATALRDPELKVAFETDRLRELGITPADIADTVAVYYQDISAGSAEVGGQRWLVRLSGTSASPEHLASLPVVQARGEVLLGDIADVTRSRESASQLVSYQGRPAVMLSITKKAGANTLELVERVNTFLQQQNANADISGVDLVLIDDQTEITRSALNVMETNMMLGLSLVLVVTWLFLGTRMALLTSIGIPFILAGTFWFLQSANQTLNVSVLLGVVISLGMLVDDAVVIAEGISFRMQRGMAALDASVETVKELFQPVTTAVLTTMAAFLPLMLLPGILGKFMFVIPLVVTSALALSLVEAYWMLPSHAMDWAIPKRSKIGPIDSFRALIKLPFKLLIQLLKLPLSLGDWIDEYANPIRQRVLRCLRRSYTRRLINVLRHPFITLISIFVVISLLMAFALKAKTIAEYLPEDLATKVAQMEVKVDFFASDPIRLYYVNVQMPVGTPLKDTLSLVKQIETKVRAHVQSGEVRQLISYSGLLFTETAPFFGDHFGQVVVALNPKKDDLRGVAEMVESMRADVVNTPGPDAIYFLTLAGGPPTSKPISVKVRGDSFDEIRPAVTALKQTLASIDGVKDISDDDSSGQRALTLQVDTDAAYRAGINPALIGRTLRLLVDGEVVASLRDRGEELDVRVLAKQHKLTSIDELLQVNLPSATGEPVALSSLLTADYGVGQNSIRHYDFRRTITVEADIDKNRVNTVEVNNRIKQIWGEQLQRQHPGIALDFSGLLDDIQDSINAMLLLFGLGIGLIYVILGTQFKSYFQPLMILFTVPMAFTGVTAGLLLNGNPLSLFTLYGVVALAGIAVNSAIVLISTANKHLDNGMTVKHATLFAARRRVVPILITSLSTIAGLFSLATGLGGHSLLWGPVATSIVWGLGFSTFLTLFLIPLLYHAFMKPKTAV
ncbi:MAG: multidrug efflux pump subunit AcrB [Gammaproteobacteria bacterium]|jgi:multidrug efflux pump subunit AcrB